MGILLTVAYDGHGFVGWAPQREGRTVHGVLLAAVRALDPSIGQVRAASRTDAGVHARAQRVAFDPSRAIAPRGWVLGANAHLSDDVAIRSARVVPVGFDPRAFGRGKRYRYVVLTDPVRDPLREGRVWRVEGKLDLAAARAEAADLMGTHDFSAFRSSKDARMDTIRTIMRADVHEGVGGDPRTVEFAIEGNAFLHHMVRIIAGTLVDVARGHRARGAIARALASGSREDLGITAPACGLVLDDVFLDLPELPAGVNDAEKEASSWP